MLSRIAPGPGRGQLSRFVCYLQGAMAEASSGDESPKNETPKTETAKAETGTEREHEAAPAEASKNEKARKPKKAGRRAASGGKGGKGDKRAAYARASGVPGDAGPLTRWRTWGTMGSVLLGAVVAWKLLGSSYRADVETICNAEPRSGFTVQHELQKLTQWVRANLETPEGNQLFSSVTEAHLTERAKRLKSEASAQNVASCPLVASYEQLAAEGEYRADLQHLCSSLSFPHLIELDDAGRLAKLVEWIDAQARSPRTKELSAQLGQAPPPERAKLLRDAAGKVDVFTCDTTKVLDSPQAAPKPAGPPTVRVTSAPQIIGSLRGEDLGKAVAQATPALTDCYKKGLEKKPDLGGKLRVKFQVDADGKVNQVVPVDLAIEDHDTVTCVLDAVKTLKLPKSPGPLVSVLLPFELTTHP
jgi:hypothetical protein